MQDGVSMRAFLGRGASLPHNLLTINGLFLFWLSLLGAPAPQTPGMGDPDGLPPPRPPDMEENEGGKEGTERERERVMEKWRGYKKRERVP